MKNYNHTGNHSNRMWSGLILLIIGVVFFLRNFGVYFPHWIFSWHTILLVIGLSVGAKRNFNGGGWLVMVLIGGYFTLQDIFGYDFSRYSFALALVAIGLVLILKPSRKSKFKAEKEVPDFNFNTSESSTGDSLEEETGKQYSSDEHDFIDSTNVFSGSKLQVVSKNFKGGDVISILGGCDLNLSQADFKDTVLLDVVAIFGGVKIIVPPSWIVKSEVTAVFGGIDDKRSVPSVIEEPRKILIIKGIALFGGVDIRNF